ncbi:ABC transporter permease [Litorilinea aerophila]|uniref:ABC transporter permease n=1 Tax=Litorilinea aerophila TaxID=1204385 RepID=A0A540VMJ1_9CHLR|nr:ABC transporter permease [Litorilinea aerophila]MCC9074694.1 ABC transporter permease [Litorilinea aerophila]OUC07059.1 ABC transporter permease [Litorilinea aerophila]GIV75870.1 MAG: ABC transporter permease [Litorilinea sp.]
MAVAQPAAGRMARPSRLRRLWDNLSIVFESRVATVGLSIVMFWLLVGVVSLFWTPYPPNATEFQQNLPPNSVNWLGTDHLGRDILSRLMQGTQVILLKTRLPGDTDLVLPGGVAIWGVLGSLVVGSILGLNAGYRGGWWDQGIMQVLDALIAFPRIVLYLVAIAALGQGDLVVILAITVTGAPGVARLVRSLTLDIKTRDYIRAAETRGESPWYIMFREILPNARGPLLVDAMLRVGYAIFAIGTLGFLGIGLPPPDPDWGNMVNEARRNIFVNQWGVIWPSVAIASLVIGLNLFADGLREELSRYQK